MTTDSSISMASARLYDLLQADYLFYDVFTSSVILCTNHTRIAFASPSLNAFLEQIALYLGSSLQGRKKAYRTLMKQTKQIPLCLNLSPVLCLLPCNSFQVSGHCYVNYQQIERIRKSPQKNRAMLAFFDGLQLEAESFARMERNYLKAGWFIRHYSSQSSQ